MFQKSPIRYWNQITITYLCLDKNVSRKFVLVRTNSGFCFSPNGKFLPNLDTLKLPVQFCHAQTYRIWVRSSCRRRDPSREWGAACTRHRRSAPAWIQCRPREKDAYPVVILARALFPTSFYSIDPYLSSIFFCFFIFFFFFFFVLCKSNRFIVSTHFCVSSIFLFLFHLSSNLGLCFASPVTYIKICVPINPWQFLCIVSYASIHTCCVHYFVIGSFITVLFSYITERYVCTLTIFLQIF
jgi:hypothetical protein